MPIPSLISLGISLSLMLSPGLAPGESADPTTEADSGTAALTQILPLTTASGDTTDVATGALDFTATTNGGSSISPMRQGILSTSSDSDWMDDSAILTQPLEVDRFMVTALTWDGGALADGMQVFIRVREESGWSQWYLVDSDTGTGPDNGGRTAGTDPFVTGGADGIQVRVSGDASSLPGGLSLQMIPSTPVGEVRLSDDDVATTSAAPTQVNEQSVDDAATDARTGSTEGLQSGDEKMQSSSDSSQSASVSTGAGATTGHSSGGAMSAVFPSTTTDNNLPVAVSSRADWGADESYMTWAPTYAAASHVIIHHTVGTNDYSMDQSAAVVRGIYYYHAVTLGWRDIGYNFLVDRWGRAYEGRSGSLESAAGKMAVGAHDQGFNTGTMGISMMGDYSSVTPSQATLDTVGKLAAWQLKRAGVDPTASVLRR